MVVLSEGPRRLAYLACLAYVVVGVICLVLAMGFTIKDRCSPRKEGDAAYLRQKGEK